MIQLVDRALEQFFRHAIPLPVSSVDVSFDAPDRTWGASVTRPTINVFLWEITRNPGFNQGGLQQQTVADGRVERRRMPPVVDLRYLVTAWATEERDEHQLLGSVLTCVLAHEELPIEMVQDHVPGSTRIALSLASREQSSPGEFWSALGGRLKPGLHLELSLPLDVFAWQEAAPVAESVTIKVGRMPEGGPGPTDRPAVADTPPIRRRRANGALVMEGRPIETAGRPIETAGRPIETAGRPIETAAPPGPSDSEPGG